MDMEVHSESVEMLKVVSCRLSCGIDRDKEHLLSQGQFGHNAASLEQCDAHKSCGDQRHGIDRTPIP